MPSPSYSVTYQALLSTAGSTLSVGSVVVRSGTAYLVSTTANRGTRRSDGLALTAADTSSPGFDLLAVGTIDAATSGLSSGSASWVRVSSTGTLERCTPSGSDDVVGWAETDGTVHLCFGFLTPTIVNGGSSVSTPISVANGGFGADVSASSGIPKIAAGAFSFVTAPTGTVVGHTDTQTLTNKTISGASNTLTVRLGSDVTGTLSTTLGGWGADVSAGNGIAKFTLGTASFVTAPSGTIVGTSDSQTLTNKTLTSPEIGGTPTVSGASASTTNDAKGTEKNVNPVNVQTTDATVTTLDSFTLASGAAVAATWLVTAVKSDLSQAAAYSCSALFVNSAGSVSQVGSTTTTAIGESDAAWDATIDNSTTTIRLRVTGKAATTVRWTAILTSLTVIP